MRNTLARRLDIRSQLPYVSLCHGVVVQRPSLQTLRHTPRTMQQSSSHKHRGDNWAMFWISHLPPLTFAFELCACLFSRTCLEPCRLSLFSMISSKCRVMSAATLCPVGARDTCSCSVGTYMQMDTHTLKILVSDRPLVRPLTIIYKVDGYPTRKLLRGWDLTSFTHSWQGLRARGISKERRESRKARE